MAKTKCEMCEKPLTGGTDTFGWPDDMCWNCYAEMNSMASFGGRLGEYEIGDYLFWPDLVAPGLGIWTAKPLLGWR